MKNWIPITGIVAVLAAGGYWLVMQPGTLGATTTLATDAPAPGQNANVVQGSSTTSTTAADASAAAASSAKPSTMQASSSSPQSAETKASSAPVALTRAIDPPQTLQINDRTWAVLGTRDVPQGNGKQTVLVLRDEVSGQLDYRQSALRFVLQPGSDYEALIRERRNAQRLFVNVMYGEIAVDAAYIAAEYSALANDKRVLKVQFMPLVAPVKPR